MPSIQNWTISKFITFYLAPVVRKPRVLAFLTALAAPLQAFRDTLSATTYPVLERRARYNAQVIRFEKLLDTELGTTGTYIDRGATAARFYAFNLIENSPQYFRNGSEGVGRYILNRLEYYPAFDFIVHIPSAVYSSQLARVTALVKKYKLAGTTFTIVPF